MKQLKTISSGPFAQGALERLGESPVPKDPADPLWEDDLVAQLQKIYQATGEDLTDGSEVRCYHVDFDEQLTGLGSVARNPHNASLSHNRAPTVWNYLLPRSMV